MDDSPAARRRAVAIAGHRGEAAVARAHLDDADPRVRATALGALSRCGELHADELRAATGDPDPAVRRRAAELGARHTEISLLELLTDPEPLVVEVRARDRGIASVPGDRDRSPSRRGRVVHERQR
jgi:HEAT repeat protein